VIANTNGGAEQEDTLRLTNASAEIVDTHLIVVVDGLSAGASLLNAEGTTRDGRPYVRLYLDGGVLLPGNSRPVTLRFKKKDVSTPVGSYNLIFLSGQGDARRFNRDGSRS
jgi:hypothetical protein